MKLGIFSDIHGNMLFFNAVLKALREKGAERLFFLGDAVSYYPNGNDVLTILREQGITCIEGNHDSMLRGEFPIPQKNDAVYQLTRSLPTFSEENMAFIRTWPDIRKEVIDGKRIAFVHGSPENHLKGYSYENTEMVNYDDPEMDYLFMGHTHRPWMRKNAHTTVINVGSAGLPRDKGCSPSFAFLDTLTGEATLERIEVDPSPILRNPGSIHEDVLNALLRE